MWVNVPISVLILAAFRCLSYELELRWKVRPVRLPTYLSHLEKKQLSLDDPRLSFAAFASRRRRKIDSPPVEIAINNFINKIVRDFVVDLWYSSITPDKEGPELIRTLILDALGEISRRIKEINLVELLTRDVVDLIGNQLDLYRRYQSEIGIDVMGTLSFEERDKRLKSHLIASKELHPALVSPECEHKVLQRLVGGILAVTLRPQEVHCPLVPCLGRELLTCLVVQPVMDFASPVYINELIEYLFIQPRSAEWALVLEAVTKRRSQVLAPENLENMWTKGKNYKRKTAKLMQAKAASRSSKTDSVVVNGNHPEEAMLVSLEGINLLKRSSSTPDIDTSFICKGDENVIYKDYYSSDFSKHKIEPSAELVSHGGGSSKVANLRCRVVGAYFEKLGSKSFAVYSIAVTDAESKTWFVKRRYRNFERLHRHLKDIPNYSLSLPPKRFLSSSIDDYFVHQRCILLDKYLQDLLSIANIAEQLEVWDFFSASSKNYSFGKSTSVMKTLAVKLTVNVDEAMDDIVRQFKRKVVGSSTSHVISPFQEEHGMALPWIEEEAKKLSPAHSNMVTTQSVSDGDVHDEEHTSAFVNGWHSDNELKGLPPRIIKRNEESNSLESQNSQQLAQLNRISFDKFTNSNNLALSDPTQDVAGVPPEWTPPNVSVPMLNLVDKVFQLNRRGWLRRQVFWISKQILQLMMEDAIDDWILRQIHQLRNDEVIAEGIKWVQDVLWPNGTFFKRIGSMQEVTDENDSDKNFTQNRSQSYSDRPSGPSSFEFQLEAARKASNVKKMILGGAPTALVSLIGHSQYRRCVKDVYYFLQSSVCLKQVAYNLLELFIVSIFPELRDLIVEIHQSSRSQNEAS
ncbi:hypothetical protein AXF42_Ash011422 [Apostasia shenzhenica]|uniref:Sorting nexin-13 n=1 Tax=Apostasia shenzhenica TaxID=1088818 RepID=A0A2I0AEG9_9ASPA|nr:hypothetical protein AXF42_Ash011422 [Apostasia shenzhenica]